MRDGQFLVDRPGVECTNRQNLLSNNSHWIQNAPGSAQECREVRGAGRVGGGGADGDATGQLYALDGDGPGEEVSELLDPQVPVAGADPGGDGELIAAQAADDAARACPVDEPGRHRGEGGVTRRVPAAVVQLLEMIDIRNEHDGVVVAVDQALRAGGESVAAQGTGERITARRCEAAVHHHGVGGAAGQRQDRRGDEKRALPGAGVYTYGGGHTGDSLRWEPGTTNQPGKRLVVSGISVCAGPCTGGRGLSVRCWSWRNTATAPASRVCGAGAARRNAASSPDGDFGARVARAGVDGAAVRGEADGSDW